jgi:hypothetical protein
MLEPQARIFEPPRRAGFSRGDTGASELAMTFQFAVQWSSLFVAIESNKSSGTPVALHKPVSAVATRTPKRKTTRTTSRKRTQTPRASVPPSNDEPSDSPNPPTGSSVQWEMVVPKMVRGNARISSARGPSLSSPSPVTVDAADPVTPLASVPETIPPVQPELRQEFSSRPRALSLATKIFLIVALAAGVAIPVATRVYRPHASSAPDASSQGASWVREPTGSKQPQRQMVLYRPSLGTTDGRMEFTWKRSDGPLSWIFRAKDKDNYYAMSIRTLRTGASPALSIDHFTVYHGIESPHASKMIILTQNNPALPIRMDVSGATFKVYLDGKPIDSWSDNRLSAGGLGFLEQPDQPAEVESVRMAFSSTGGA